MPPVHDREVESDPASAHANAGVANAADTRTTDGFTVSIVVAVDVQRAFQAFTEETDLWWLRGPKHRFRAPYHDGYLHFDKGVGGRLVEHYPDGSSFTIGQVLDWRPGELVHLSWRLPSFAPDERTEVVVSFAAATDGTRVSVEHRGWTALRRDHPALHGRDARGAAFLKGGLWAETLTALRTYLSGETP
jgi:hypothetical protein